MAAAAWRVERMRVLITGVAGFVAGHLVDFLRAEQPRAQIVGLDARPGNRVTAMGIDIVQADIERKRIRALRCMNPMLTPDALAAAAQEPQLGGPWIDELLEDCPQFAGFIGDLALRRLVQLQQLEKEGLNK